MIALLLVACGGSEATSAPAPTLPPPTPTPRSTPLPEVPTPVLLGSAEQPLQLAFVLPEINSQVQAAKRDLAAQLNQRVFNERLNTLGLVTSIEVESYLTMADALAALCSHSAPLVWVDAFTYIAAEDACGAQPLLAVRKSTRQRLTGLPASTTVNAATGLTFDVVYHTRLGAMAGGLAEIAGKRVCRLGPDDPLWVYFSLTLRGAGLDPFSGPAALVNVDNYTTMLQAMTAEDPTCDVGMIPRGTLSRVGTAALDTDLTASDAPLRILSAQPTTWPEVPYTILVSPPPALLPPDLRQAVLNALQEYISATDDDNDSALHTLLEFQQIVPVTAADYDAFRQWLRAAGWQMSR